MKSVLGKGTLTLAITLVVALALFVYRNIRLDEGISAWKSGDDETALYKLEPLALVGDSEAQDVLGKMYAFGWGVEKDDDKALMWLRRAGRWSEAEPVGSSIGVLHRKGLR